MEPESAQNPPLQEPDPAPRHLSAKATRQDGSELTAEEIEAAEEEALAWARKSSCC